MSSRKTMRNLIVLLLTKFIMVANGQEIAADLLDLGFVDEDAVDVVPIVNPNPVEDPWPTTTEAPGTTTTTTILPTTDATTQTTTDPWTPTTQTEDPWTTTTPPTDATTQTTTDPWTPTTQTEDPWTTTPPTDATTQTEDPWTEPWIPFQSEAPRTRRPLPTDATTQTEDPWTTPTDATTQTEDPWTDPWTTTQTEDQWTTTTITTTTEAITTAEPLSPEEQREENFNKDTAYLLLIPKQFYVSTQERICLLVTKSDSILEYRVTLLFRGVEEYWSSGDREAEQGDNFLEFDVPEIESGGSQRLTVRLQLRRRGALDVGEDGYEVTKDRFVQVQTQGGQRTFVQTDKPIYQPGQIVRFRALTLNSELKPITEPFDSIVIENPSRTRINQWDDVEADLFGLIDLAHDLPDEPQQGTYTIRVTRGNEQVSETFSVEEYVLPRFEVEIISPSYVLITEPRIKIKICGTYTYGKPVQGSIQANITAGGGRYDWVTRTFVTREVLSFDIPSTDANGCAVIDVDLERLELASRRFSIYGSGASVSTVATFTETVTGETVTKSSDSDDAPLSATPFSLAFVSDNNVYKPNLPFFGVVQVTNPDGSPRPNENVIVRCDRFNTAAEVASDEFGYALFQFPAEEGYTGFNSTNSLSCNVTAVSFPERLPYNPDIYTLTQPISFTYLSPLYSPSDNYLDVEPVVRPTAAGQEVNLRVHTTCDCPGGVKVLAVSRGNIIKDFEFSADLEAGDGIVYNLNFGVTPIMTPRLDLLVYCILEAEDGEMIADSLQIDSNAVFENEVHIQVADGQNAELEPGAQTSIEIIATPESLCAIGVVDESVHLLGGDNQIQKTEVVSFLNRFQLSEGDSFNAPCQETKIEESTDDGGPFPQPFRQPIRAVVEPIEILARKKRQFGFFPPFSRDPYPKYTDVTKEFEELGLVRITNLNIETSPCERPEPFPYYYYAFPVLQRQAFAAFADGVVLEAVAVGGPPAIRSYFPETWLWQLLRPEESPIVTVPDVITEWIGAGFCISPITGFGISEPFTVNAFKPFFGDYNLPYSVIRGEELQLQVNIFNYVDNCLPVEVTLRGSGEFDLVDSSNRKRVCVCSGSEPTQVTFDVRPLVLGEVDLETTFNVVYGQDICRGELIEEGVTHSDGLSKPILVEPEGEEIEDSFNLYFCPSDEEDGIFRHTFDVTVPEEYVADSGRVIIFLSGDILGNSLTNIDSLLRIPYGCGEQNMLGFVPNIYALQYLRATGQADQLQTNKAISNMIKGYQDQLNYRRTSGAYSAFGNSDPEGSAWLSAYVVRSFAQAGQFIKIDNNDLQRTIRWLLNNLGQRDDGCFMNRGRVIHKEMQGGVNDEVSLTAFILVSLLEAGMPREDEAIVNALFCIGNSLGSLTDPNQETDTYSAALIAYALSIAKDPRVAIVMNYLESVAINEGGVKYWVSNRPQTGSSRRYGSGASASSISIEMTGYVLLTYINIHGIDGVALGSPVSKWLVSQQGPRGGFKSSQDTVVAIHALAEYAGLVFGGDTNLAVVIYQEPCTLSSIFTIHGGNRLVLQRADLEHFPDIINVLATGDGCALIQVIIRFNVHPKPPLVPPFTLTYTVGPSGQLPCIRSFRLNVCVSYTGEDGFSNMAIVEVKLVSGFIPPRDLDSLIQGDLTLIEYRQKSVIFYFRQCTAEEICFSLDLESVHVVRDPKPGLIKVYDYYDPDLILATEYELTCQLRPIPLPIEIVEEEDNVPPVEEIIVVPPEDEIIVVPPEDEIIVPPEENFNL